MWLNRLILAAFALLALAGCGQTLDLRSDPYDGGPIPRHHLEVLTSQPLTLTTSESVTFEVRYTGPTGAPIEGAEVELLLEIGAGSPGTDAALMEVVVLTDADGVATGSVMAGTMAASFRIRASAYDAAAVFVDVSVSDAGFGDLHANASYSGARSPSELTIVAFGQTSCEEAQSRVASADRAAVVDIVDPTVSFDSLPAALPYAVAAYFRSELSDTTVAWGCVEDVVVVADDVTSANVTVVDLPLQPGGLYSGEATLSADTAPATIEAALSSSAATLVGAFGGDAAYLLTDLVTALADEGETTCAANLGANLAAAIPLVQGELDGASEGVDEALALGAAQAAARAALLKLSGAFTITAEAGGALVTTYQVTGLSLGADDGSAPVPVNVTALDLDASVALVGSWSASRDFLAVNSLPLPLPLSAVAAGLVTVDVNEAGADDAGAWLGDMGVCPSFASSATLGGYGCSAAALETVCRDRMELALALVLAQVEADLDDTRLELELVTGLDFADTDDDLIPETLSGDVVGTWTGPGVGTSDTAFGAFDGVRVGSALLVGP